MPWRLQRFQEAQCLHFITSVVNTATPCWPSHTPATCSWQMLERSRGWYGFYVCGFVVMPEHIHLLISEPERSKLSIALQMLKQNSARELHPVEGAPSWEPRYYDFNV